MKLYINTKKIILKEDNIEHELILKAKEEEFLGYDLIIDTEIVKQIDDRYIVREEKTWWSFPLYEIIDNKIVDFDYTQYKYFVDTNRRMTLAKKIGKVYNPASENKIMRKTLKKILDHLELEDNSFEKYNRKVSDIIEKNPKDNN